MAAIRTGMFTGEVALGVGEERTGNVGFVIEAPAERKVGERMSAIHDDPRRIVEMKCERRRVNERRERHV